MLERGRYRENEASVGNLARGELAPNCLPDSDLLLSRTTRLDRKEETHRGDELAHTEDPQTRILVDIVSVLVFSKGRREELGVGREDGGEVGRDNLLLDLSPKEVRDVFLRQRG